MKPKLIIVTAASSNHFTPLLNLLYTLGVNEPMARVVTWDIGLTEEQRQWFTNELPPFHWPGEVRQFPFEKYPAHFGMDQFAGRLAWRPTVILEAMKEFGGTVLWLDAGCLATRPLKQIRNLILQHGVFCKSCSGLIKDHLDPSSHEGLNVTEAVGNLNMRDAGVVGFNSANPQAVALVERWAQVALQPELVGPPGSTRRTHRQDALFTALFYAAGFTTDCIAPGEISTKQDNTSLKEVQFRLAPGPSLTSFMKPSPYVFSRQDQARYQLTIQTVARRIK